MESPLAQKELTDMILYTRQPAFYDKMVGSVSSCFSDLVIIGGRIQQGLKNYKIINVVGSSNNVKFSGALYV